MECFDSAVPFMEMSPVTPPTNLVDEGRVC